MAASVASRAVVGAAAQSAAKRATRSASEFERLLPIRLSHQIGVWRLECPHGDSTRCWPASLFITGLHRSRSRALQTVRTTLR